MEGGRTYPGVHSFTLEWFSHFISDDTLLLLMQDKKRSTGVGGDDR